MMQTTKTLLLALLLASLATPALQARASDPEDGADLILRHGRFYPVSSPGAVEGSLAIRDGRISYLGDDAGAMALAGDETETIDLAGRTVTPGLIDAHSHLSGLGAALVQVDLVGAGSYDEVIRRVKEAAATAEDGVWVRGRGWDQTTWADKSFPTHQALSAAVPDHPVWLTRIDGHAALLNARAMDLLGIDAATEDPSGGRLLRDDQGRPTGVLVDQAMTRAAGRIPEPGPDERRRELELAAHHVVAVGLTTVTDMGVGDDTIGDYRALRDAGDLPVRAALFVADRPELLDRWFASGPEIDPDRRVTVRGIKLYADGALGSRGAALIEPYSDDPGNLGLLITGEDHIEEVGRRALAAGFQVAVHAIGDRANLITLDGMEAAFDGKPRPEVRFRLEHAQVMRPQDITRCARLGIVFSYQPRHATSDMDWAGERVGARRLEGAYAWRTALDAGGRLALGSDFPVEPADPRLGLYAAVTRQDLDGQPPGGWYPDQRLTREEALRGFTLDAAWSLFLDDQIGSLDVGKRADLVVFGRDLMTVPAREIPEVPIDYTLVDGAIVYRGEGGR